MRGWEKVKNIFHPIKLCSPEATFNGVKRSRQDNKQLIKNQKNKYMKKIILSVAVIAAVAAIGWGVTTAFFSDTETSTGNTFTAGSLDLTVDSQCTYNGEPQGFCNWNSMDLTTGKLFFNFLDVKPGDSGEDTISLHVDNNDACGFVKITRTSDSDVTCTEPELGVESGCLPGGDGELDENVIFSVWADTCALIPAVPGDNIYQANCDTPLTTGTLDAVENWGLGKLLGNSTTYYGISWELPAAVGNEVQSDSFMADVEFTIEQFRNQFPNGCPAGEIEFVRTSPNGGNETNATTQYNGYYLPHLTYDIDGTCIDFTFINPTPFLFAFDYRVDGEVGTNGTWYDVTIHEGLLNGQKIGPEYNLVTVVGNSSQSIEVCGQDEIQVGLRQGAEQKWYFDWITFQAQ
jgi:predicted ribosomally synthesized peptide with SipW-like signal peptide